MQSEQTATLARLFAFPCAITCDPTGTNTVRWELPQDDGPYRTPRRDHLPVCQRGRKLLDNRWRQRSYGQRVENKHPGRAGSMTSCHVFLPPTIFHISIFKRRGVKCRIGSAACVAHACQFLIPVLIFTTSIKTQYCEPTLLSWEQHNGTSQR